MSLNLLSKIYGQVTERILCINQFLFFQYLFYVVQDLSSHVTRELVAEPPKIRFSFFNNHFFFYLWFSRFIPNRITQFDIFLPLHVHLLDNKTCSSIPNSLENDTLNSSHNINKAIKLKNKGKFKITQKVLTRS